MSKFGLMDSEPEQNEQDSVTTQPSLSDRLARFGTVAPRPQVDLAAADAAAAQHGFVSREAAPAPAPQPYAGYPAPAYQGGAGYPQPPQQGYAAPGYETPGYPGQAYAGMQGQFGAPSRMRRRRNMPMEPTRHLAIRLAASQYDRFVAYADLHRLTYHEALVQLMDEADAGKTT